MSKTTEKYIKKLLYGILGLIFRNKPAEIPLDTSKIRKILIFRYDAIGDMIVTTPVFNLLREKLPNAEIHVVASHRNFGMVKNDNRIAKFYIFNGSFGSLKKLIHDARKENYDVIFNFVLSRTTKAGFIANLIERSAVKINVRHEERDEIYKKLFNLRLPLERDKFTMAELQTQLICTTFGWKWSENLVRILIEISDKNRKLASKFIQTLPKSPRLLFNLSSGNPFREWSHERNSVFLRLLHEKFPQFMVIFISAPNDAEKAKLLNTEFSNFTAIFPPTPDFLNICALTNECDILFSPDTSLVHVGAAYGKPVFVLYSRLASFIREWMPFGVPYRAVITEGREPLSTISAEKAFGKFCELVEEVGILKEKTQ